MQNDVAGIDMCIQFIEIRSIVPRTLPCRVFIHPQLPSMIAVKRKCRIILTEITLVGYLLQFIRQYMNPGVIEYPVCSLRPPSSNNSNRIEVSIPQHQFVEVFPTFYIRLVLRVFFEESRTAGQGKYT